MGHRAGTIELAIPKLRQGSYYPEWLLERRRRAERALATAVAASYLLGMSTRRVEKLAESLRVTKLSKSQVSVMAAELDEMATSFRSRPLDGGPYVFVWIDALTQKAHTRDPARTCAMLRLRRFAEGARSDDYLGSCVQHKTPQVRRRRRSTREQHEQNGIIRPAVPGAG